MTQLLAKIDVAGACRKLIYQKLGESDAEFMVRCDAALPEFITAQPQQISITYIPLPDDNAVEALRRTL